MSQQAMTTFPTVGVYVVQASDLNPYTNNIGDHETRLEIVENRRMGSVVLTAAAATIPATETIIGHFTFTAGSTRRYAVYVGGPLNNGTSSNTAALYRVRWVAGSTVTNTSNDFLEAANGLFGANFTQSVAAYTEVAPGTWSGTTTVGVAPVQTAGTGSTYGNGANQPIYLQVQDIGT
jgi:hypothetical protein